MWTHKMRMVFLAAIVCAFAPVGAQADTIVQTDQSSMSYQAAGGNYIFSFGGSTVDFTMDDGLGNVTDALPGEYEVTAVFDGTSHALIGGTFHMAGNLLDDSTLLPAGSVNLSDTITSFSYAGSGQFNFSATGSQNVVGEVTLENFGSIFPSPSDFSFAHPFDGGLGKSVASISVAPLPSSALGGLCLLGLSGLWGVRRCR
jgi:hypothetical protein